MKRLTSLLALATLLATLTAGCDRPAPAEPEVVPQLVLMDRTWAYQSNPGREIRTPHYRIFTTHTDPVVVNRLPQFLETAYLHYQHVLSASREPDGPMVVYLFGNRDEWNRFTDEFTGRSAATYRKIVEGGYVDRGTAVYYDIRRMKTFAVTGHEGFHQYVVHYCRHRLPAWLDEGMACYFEGFFWEGSALTFQPRNNLLRRRALRFSLTRSNTIELSELLSTHPGKIIGGPADRVASYYAQLWALMLYLQEGPYREQFDKLLADAGTDRMLEQAANAGYRGRPGEFGLTLFRAYFGSNLSAIERDFEQYCIKLTNL